MRQILLLALAGALGTLARYGVGRLIKRQFGEGFPYGTLVVNVVGCFLLGLLMQLVLRSEVIPPEWRVPVTVGFLGAFTTFSTFGYETMRYVTEGAWLPAATNVGANLLVGFLAVWGGLMLGRAVLA